MQEGKLYLVFDYLSMDLKKYIDSYVHGKQLELTTIKSLTYQVCYHFILHVIAKLQYVSVSWLEGLNKLYK